MNNTLSEHDHLNMIIIRQKRALIHQKNYEPFAISSKRSSKTYDQF